ncbi:hypothetical protein IFM89_025375 [Coptis chinensis]|uniref:Galectin domain-containing protein n=1 Tax=Coptis chinensis TaxID=261450 RepID=A0A835IU46_9MAGN|nr:hypothetical protein IFM89_025375 [Coptis chinensis]
MKRVRSEAPFNNVGNGGRKFRLSHFLLGLATLYLIFIYFKFPQFLEIATTLGGVDDASLVRNEEPNDVDLHRLLEEENEISSSSNNAPLKLPPRRDGESIKPLQIQYGRITGQILRRMENKTTGVEDDDYRVSSLERMANEAWTLGTKALKELENNVNEENTQAQTSVLEGRREEGCTSSVQVSGEQLEKGDGEHLLFLPCGLAAGSSITVIGTPHHAHEENIPHLARLRRKDSKVLVSQFMVELQGLKAVDGEDPPRILHLNPRLRGDWSHKPVIEHNTCYRMQWGTGQRCDGVPSKNDDDLLVDGFRRCEKWILRAVVWGQKSPRQPHGSKRFIGRGAETEVTWPFAFVEGRMFVLTVRAGVEGYHISVGGRHMTSFPYRTNAWQLGKHGCNPAAVKSSNVVSRFFVALNPRREVNAVLKKEAAYFGDVVILPFMDRYELVVLKTIAICKYGIHNLTASYIMKCDDDTFVRVDTVLKEISGISPKKSLYMGNLNLLHRPLRNGKWAVTYEEWPEEVYPPYANGPGYIISIDIAKFIVSQHANQSLRLFKMEDVSVGMWVEQFNSSTPVQYSHNWKFCQYGCMEDYYTAHYQSPRQMLCLWDKLARGRAHCCNFR